VLAPLPLTYAPAYASASEVKIGSSAGQAIGVHISNQRSKLKRCMLPIDKPSISTPRVAMVRTPRHARMDLLFRSPRARVRRAYKLRSARHHV